LAYDAIIIGSGQGGNPLAYGLADKGWQVALIEKEHLGGTCVNTGCTPTKTMVHCAQVAHYARDADRWGVRTEGVTVDMGQVRERKRQIVDRFRGGHERQVERRDNLRLYRRHGRLVDKRRVQVGDEVIEGERIFLNTGTRADIPALEGLGDIGYLTSASIMELDALPEHLLVLGGGYIGLEFGQMFRRFGSEVTVVHRGARVLTREDDDIAEELQKALEAEGVRFALNARPTRVAKRDGRITLTMETPEGQTTVTGSHLLVATGRRPNADDLGLEKAGVETDERGFVRVNSRLETNVPGIWAIGDVKGGPAFTHISYNDYQIVYGNLIDDKSLSIENRIVPYAVFTDPQLGRVGMTEAEARKSGRRLKIGSIPMSGVARALERGETAGKMKLVVDADTDRVLGAAILATEGGELVQILGALMLAGAPYTLLKGAIYIHPTLAEGLWSLMEEVKAVADSRH
jgi:pyruvate/2-oxoglutarate dehydrogenase complex dihydrolipoamide dehydrogenase (E3) component